MPGNVLDTGYTLVNKTDVISAFVELIDCEFTDKVLYPSNSEYSLEQSDHLMVER